MTDLLVRIGANRDRQAYQAMFVYFAPRVKGFLMSKGADSALAEELMQDTMLTVWTKASMYHPGRGSASTWIFTIARNLRIDKLRRESVQHFDDVDGLEIAEDDPNTGRTVVAQDDAVIAGQERRLVAAAMKRLPTDQAEVIRLSFVDDLSQHDIADRLGLPLGTVKSRMRLAYNKLRQALESEL
ncbi:sigma-70 family RNA polymerase sigma factor [Microbaculum marinum]|uniref:Sigma-70 family RNA polymerase sigma factor n=2 Tax=Microbaculum marinum TaxID=1764581 RepID=A0AAW9RQ78_9HYPH